MTFNNNIEKFPKYVYFTILLLILSFIFYILDCYNIQNNDDYIYSCVIDSQGRPQEHITNIGQVITSAYHHFFTWNGRIIANCLIAQSFCGLLGMGAFRICNSIVFFFFIFLLQKLSNALKSNACLKLLIAIVVIFTVSPSFASMFLGTIDYSVNYLWTVTGILFVLTLSETLKRQTVQHRIIPLLGIFISGFLSGAMHEGFSIGLLGAICLYYFFHRKSLNNSIIILFSGFLLGTVFTVIAPANFIRAQDVSSGGILAAFCRMFLNLRIIYLFIIINIVLYIYNKDICINFIKKNIIYYLATAISLFFVIVIAKRADARALFCAEFFALLPTLSAIYLFLDYLSMHKRLYIHICTILSCLYIGIGSLYAYNLRKDLCSLHREFINGYIESNDGITYIDNRLIEYKDNRFSPSTNDYIIKDAWWANYTIPNYYNTKNKPILVLPKSLKSPSAFFIQENQAKENPLLYTQTDMCCYILNINDIASLDIHEICIHEIPKNSMTLFILSKLNKHLHTIRKTSSSFDYLIIEKNNLFSLKEINVLIDGKSITYADMKGNNHP